MLSDYFEAFTLLRRAKTPDGQGGMREAWYDYLPFEAALTHVTGAETRIAGLQHLATVPALLHEFDVTLKQDDMVRREADGGLYRVAGNSWDMRTPRGAGLAFAQVPVERVEAARW